jgi:hypothetical protein
MDFFAGEKYSWQRPIFVALPLNFFIESSFPPCYNRSTSQIPGSFSEILNPRPGDIAYVQADVHPHLCSHRIRAGASP